MLHVAPEIDTKHQMVRIERSRAVVQTAEEGRSKFCMQEAFSYLECLRELSRLFKLIKNNSKTPSFIGHQNLKIQSFSFLQFPCRFKNLKKKVNPCNLPIEFKKKRNQIIT